jgi:hypothetical protein
LVEYSWDPLQVIREAGYSPTQRDRAR